MTTSASVYTTALYVIPIQSPGVPYICPRCSTDRSEIWHVARAFGQHEHRLAILCCTQLPEEAEQIPINARRADGPLLAQALREFADQYTVLHQHRAGLPDCAGMAFSRRYPARS
jgi:hypothetical protein